MDYLEAGKIRTLKSHAKHLMFNSEDGATCQNVLSEINVLIEISEANRKAIAPNSNSNSMQSSMLKQGGQNSIEIEQLNLHS